MNQGVDTIEFSLLDPNPSESAEYSLTLMTRPSQEVDGDAIGAEMVELYDRNASFGLFCKVLDELEQTNSSVIYVGTHDKCAKWSVIFESMDIQTSIDRI